MAKKVYIITGSTSGIGKALTEYYSKNNIVFAGYRNHKLKIEKENVIPFFIDYSKPKTIQNAIKILSKNKIDTIINVAGCVIAGAVEDLPMDDLRKQFDVNVFGALELSRALNPSKIINISSMSSYGLFPFIAPYCASKRASDILFNLYQIETKKKVKVISLKLGSVATPIWRKSVQENKKTLQITENYKKEYEYLIKNALDNETKAMPIKEIVKEIVKIDNKKNPKPSYNIGLDAKLTGLFSLLPQQIINFVIKQKIKHM